MLLYHKHLSLRTINTFKGKAFYPHEDFSHNLNTCCQSRGSSKLTFRNRTSPEGTRNHHSWSRPDHFPNPSREAGSTLGQRQITSQPFSILSGGAHGLPAKNWRAFQRGHYFTQFSFPLITIIINFGVISVFYSSI